jgi:hypothetical protein
MSTATPFLYREGFFPASDYGSSSLDGWDYVTLTQTDSDLGLREAMRIWWMLEQVTVTPSGSVTLRGITQSFSKVYRAPDCLDIASSGASSYLRGAICASLIGATLNTPIQQPVNRVVLRAGNGGLGSVLGHRQIFAAEEGNTDLRVTFIGGEWRLYYRFLFLVVVEVTSPASLAALLIQNPARSAIGYNPLGITGSNTVAGYSLNWSAFSREDPAATFSGVGLSASSVEWTF